MSEKQDTIVVTHKKDQIRDMRVPNTAESLEVMKAAGFEPKEEPKAKPTQAKG